MSVSSIYGGLKDLDDARERAADPDDDSITGKLVESACDAYAASPGAATGLAASAGAGAAEALNKTMGYTCQPYWDRANIDPPEITPAVIGGQCPGVQYTARINPATGSQGPQVGATGAVIGPVISVSFEQPSEGEAVVNVTVEIIHNNGNSTLTDTNQLVEIFPNGTQATPYRVQFTRVDGLPDECGNRPETYSPGADVPDIDYGDDNVKNVGGSPTVFNVGAPQIDIDGDVYFPVSTEFGDVDFYPTVESPRPSEPSDPAPVEGTPVEPTGDAGEVEDDIPPEDEELDFETIGYRWDLLDLPENPSAVPKTSPLVMVTTYGNIQLVYRTEGGLKLYENNLPIKVESGSVYKSVDSFAVIGVAYSKRPDVGRIRLTPIRARKKRCGSSTDG